METKYKIVIGVAAVVIVGAWVLTTKNEVVESVVFPLKKKLGLVN